MPRLAPIIDTTDVELCEAKIKEFLKEWESKGHSMYRLRHYERCIDDEFYELVELQGTGVGEKYKGFVRLK